MANPVPSSKERMATMKVDNKAFVKELGRITNKLRIRDWPQLVKEIGVAFLQGVIPMTPVASIETAGYVGGRARAGWYMAASKLNAPFSEVGDQDFIAIGRREGEYFQKLVGDDKPYIVITNGVPYVLILEFGYSDQAPAGMARVTMSKIKGLFKNGSARALKRAVTR